MEKRSRCNALGFVFLFSFLTLHLTLHTSSAFSIELITISTDPAYRAGDSFRPIFNKDGTALVFETYAAFGPEDTDNLRDIYYLDRQKKQVRRVSTGTAHRASAGGTLSSNGKVIAYHASKNIVRDRVLSNVSDIYYSSENNVVLRLDDFDGESLEGDALYPRLSSDGRWMVFTATINKGIRSRENSFRQVYLSDLKWGDTEVISRNAAGSWADRPCAEAQISGDGQVVVYLSAAGNFDPPLPQESQSYHLYRYDRSRNETLRIDRSSRGFADDRWIVGRFDLSRNGRFIVFEARPRNTLRNDQSLQKWDLFLYDHAAGRSTRLTEGQFSTRCRMPSISADGGFIAFRFLGTGGNKGNPPGLVVYDRQESVWRRLVTGSIDNPALSEDGHWVAFDSADASLLSAKRNRVRHIFVVENPQAK